jgi:Mg-chelatase subunit ChlD
VSFQNPLGLLLLFTLPVIVILHLFRQERRRQEVSSLFLWREISDQHSRRIRPRLLRNINLLLQLLVATAASVALAQPVIRGRAVGSATELILLVDTSASMRANEGQVSRLELAKNRARELVGRSRRDTQVLVATAGARPSVAQAFTTDRQVVYDAIRDIGAEDGQGDLEEAARLVRRLDDGEPADVVFLTDGALTGVPAELLPRKFRVETVGTPRANRGITAFEIRRRFRGNTMEAYLEIASFGGEEADTTVELIADGALIARRTVTLGENEVRAVTADIPSSAASVFTARIADNDDALVTDDVAHLIRRSIRPIRVQLVTAGNYYLESILAVYPDVELTVRPTVDQGEPYDVIVLDEVDAPAGLGGRILALDAEVPGAPFEPDSYVPVRFPVTVDPAHPISANLELGGVNITRAMSGELTGRSRVVAASGGLPLIFTAEWEGVQLVQLAFSLADTDLGLRSSFPILIHNSLRWLAPPPQEQEIGALAAGSSIPLLVEPGEQVTVTSPDGTSYQFAPRENTILFRDTREAGIYTVRGETFADSFAVSLSSQEESNLTPRLNLAEMSGETDSQEADEAPGTPAWPWLTVLALLLLTADWVVWARRT